MIAKNICYPCVCSDLSRSIDNDMVGEDRKSALKALRMVSCHTEIT